MKSIFNHLPILVICSAILILSSCEEDPPPPIITSVTPEFGAAESLIIFEGMHLAGIKTLTFNGEITNFNTAYNSDVALLFRIPTSMEIGEYEVEFTTDGGSTSVPFRVTLEAPEVFSFNESMGEVGEEITMYGKNFFEPLEVYFTAEVDSVQAQIVNHSPDSIRVIVPDGAVAGFVTLVANGGGAQSPTRFSVVDKIPVNDFDGNGARSDTEMWNFLPGSPTATRTVTDLNPIGIDGNFLKLKGRDDGAIGFISSLTSPSADPNEFLNFGIRTATENTLLEFNINNNGQTDTRLIIVLKERDGSNRDFSYEFGVDETGWNRVSLPLTRFQDVDGNLIDATKVKSIRFILFDTESTGSDFEVNIDNLRFVEIL